MVNAERLSEAIKLLAGSVKLLGRSDQLHSPPHPNPEQESWNQFRLSLVLWGSLHTARFLAAGKPLPEHELIAEEMSRSQIVRIACFLDDLLDDYIISHSIPLSPKARLFDRIEAIHTRGLISNATELHALRCCRNDIGHLPSPPPISGSAVFHFASEVEVALHQLGVLDPAPDFAMSKCELSAAVPSATPGEFRRRTLTLGISANGKDHLTMTWTYVHLEGSGA